MNNDCRLALGAPTLAWLAALLLAGCTPADPGAADVATAPTLRQAVARPHGDAGNALTTVAPLLSDADRRFLLRASAGRLYELDAARLATQRASLPSVRSFAAMLAVEQADLVDALHALAAARALSLPLQPPGHSQAMDELATLADGDFDRQFMLQVGIALQRRDIDWLQQAAPAVSDPELRAWAERALPVLQDQLEAAEQVPLTTPLRVLV